MRRRLLGALMSLLIALSLSTAALPGAASAHPANSTYYPMGWQERDIYYYFSGTSWSSIGSIASRMRDAAWQWSMLNEGGFRYVDGGARTLSSTGCNGANENGLFWQWLDGPGNKAGRTYWCTYNNAPGRIYSMRLVMDGSETNWYTGTGTPSSGSLDLWSLGVHEFGHVTGFLYHWDEELGEPALCPFNVYRESMCAAVVLGTTYSRSPHDHDKHTFGNRY
jgi:hypothetical protein